MIPVYVEKRCSKPPTRYILFYKQMLDDFGLWVPSSRGFHPPSPLGVSPKMEILRTQNMNQVHDDHGALEKCHVYGFFPDTNLCLVSVFSCIFRLATFDDTVMAITHQSPQLWPLMSYNWL